ncbi:Shedu anti-phage system protein SduA domain-containing protein [Bacillus sp. Marseille-Q1617]|uniref:Shedu anti-phage system protein SduA domain-containing protein n=1 Tax=Bacillus sp. Marseille-Q1617 TaxID=2736887 RepID=UPI00158B8DB0|nr:Shedu anti-phage system protein SduA domain-containing protein [Bacillus sp. Marseille-Q1617]
MKITTTSTSLDTAQGQDIILRETTTTRLLFRPMISNNAHNSDASVKGWFVYQRKRLNGNWEDYKELDNNQLRADEWIKLEIKSEEMLKLMTELDVYYKIHREYGIQLGVRTYSKTELQLEKITEMFREDSSLFDSLLEFDGNKSEILHKTIKWMGDTENSEEIVSRLLEIQEDELDHLNNVVGIANLKKLLAIWEGNSDNDNEEFWQRTFNENAWVLSQIFASPFLDFQQKAYVGGKTVENREGKIVDYIYQNDLSKEVALIEIKTPNTRLLSSEYRTGIFSVHSDLTGSVVQVLGYKEQITRDYAQLRYDYDRDFKVFNPQCVVIAGKLGDLSKNQLQSFELYRKEMKNVLVVTFDELFKKVQLLLDLLAE